MSLFGKRGNREDDEFEKLIERMEKAVAPPSFSPLKESELRDFQPLELRPGDKVKWKKGLNYVKAPKEDEVIIVSRVAGLGGMGMPQVFYKHGDATFNVDFCSAFLLEKPDSCSVCEYPFDSRYFEKVT